MKRVILTLRQLHSKKWVQGTESLNQINALHCGLTFPAWLKTVKLDFDLDRNRANSSPNC